MEVSPYALRPLRPGGLNARDQSPGGLREGFLLRHEGGHGCVHPWPELGDAPVAEQRRLLQIGELTPLTRRALDCAALDGAARREGRSLFQGLICPPSHALAPPGLPADDIPALAARWQAEGFTAVKLKLGAEPSLATHALRAWMECGEGGRLRFRLDFNETGSQGFFEDWLGALPPAWRRRIEFIEDPLPWTAETWAWWGRTLPVDAAVDRRGPEADAWGPQGTARWRIVKPALEAWPPPDAPDHSSLWKPARVVFTSYLDHALGQRFAAWEAARAGAVSAGLLTHGLFEPDAFFQRQASEGPRLRIAPEPGETGLGLDAPLAALKWEPLQPSAGRQK